MTQSALHSAAKSYTHNKCGFKQLRIPVGLDWGVGGLEEGSTKAQGDSSTFSFDKEFLKTLHHSPASSIVPITLFLQENAD